MEANAFMFGATVDFGCRVVGYGPPCDAVRLLPAIHYFGYRVCDYGPPLAVDRLPLAIPSVAVAVSVHEQICAVLQLASSIACQWVPRHSCCPAVMTTDLGVSLTRSLLDATVMQFLSHMDYIRFESTSHVQFYVIFGTLFFKKKRDRQRDRETERHHT